MCAQITKLHDWLFAWWMVSFSFAEFQWRQWCRHWLWCEWHSWTNEHQIQQVRIHITDFRIHFMPIDFIFMKIIYGVDEAQRIERRKESWRNRHDDKNMVPTILLINVHFNTLLFGDSVVSVCQRNYIYECVCVRSSKNYCIFIVSHHQNYNQVIYNISHQSVWVAILFLCLLFGERKNRLCYYL